MVEIPEEAKGWTLREAGHFNGGRAWFGYLFRCIQEPRLSRFDRYTRKPKGVTSTWRVDGVDVGDLVEAVEALKTPPTITEEEAAALAKISATEAADHRQDVGYAMLYALHNKGLIEYLMPGRCRRRGA